MLTVAMMTPGAAYAGTQSEGAMQGTLTIEWSPSTSPPSADPFSVWMLQSIAGFEKANPKVSISVTDDITGNSYLAKIDSQMAAHTTPDIFVGWTEKRMFPYATAGRLLNLKSYILTSPVVSHELSNFALSTVTYKGGIYAIPLLEDSEVMYYNKALFAKYGLGVPSTYAQFLSDISVFKSHGIIPIALEDSESWEGSIMFTQLAERFGGIPLYKDVVLNGTAKFDNPAYVQVGDMVQALVKDGAFNSDFLSEDSPYAQTVFSEGKAAMWDMGTWDIPALWQALHNKLGWFPFPSVPGGKGNGTSNGMILNTDDAVSLSPDASAQTKALAWDFMSYLLSPSRQDSFAGLGEPIATTTPLTSTNTNPVNASIHGAATSTAQPMFPWDDVLGTALGEDFDNATQKIYNGQSPASALGEVDQFRTQLNG
jgi:raffinose/stachyose/melibiose transport system substrate-binding protein